MIKTTVQWHLSSEFPSEWGDFAHGIHFHDTEKEPGKDLVAFLEGFDWLHGNSDVAHGYVIQPDAITTDAVLTAMKRQVEQLVASRTLAGHQELSRRISGMANA
jgi:hypothetical protein